METSKIIINSALMLITIVLGVVLHKTGKPYNNLLFTAHKLITLGFVVYLAIVMVNYDKLNGFNPLLVAFTVLLMLSVIALMVSGALLSLDKLETAMLKLHRISTAGAILGFAGIVYGILF